VPNSAGIRSFGSQCAIRGAAVCKWDNAALSDLVFNCRACGSSAEPQIEAHFHTIDNSFICHIRLCHHENLLSSDLLSKG
jgi:hypothetical protein